MKELAIIESASGVFYYHLAVKGTLKPICESGRPMMPTMLPLKTWGMKTHLGERYCATCDLKRKGES